MCAFTVGTDRCSRAAISALRQPRADGERDLVLPLGEPGQPLARGPRTRSGPAPAVSWAISRAVTLGRQHRVAVGHPPDRLDDRRRRGVLEQEAAGARHRAHARRSRRRRRWSARSPWAGAPTTRCCSVASSPFIRGIRMSMSTTSGRCSRAAATPSRPSTAWPTTSMSGAPPRIITSPERTSASSSTTSTRIGAVVSSRHGSHPCSSNVPPSRRVSSRPPASLARSPSPTRPSPAPGVPTPLVACRLRAGLRIRMVDPVGRRAADVDQHGDAGRVLAGVGQALLDDPVRRPADLLGHLRHVVHPVVVLHPHPGLLGLQHQRAQVAEGRLRALAEAGRVVAAQHAEHLPQVAERLVRLGLDQLGGLAHLVGGEVGAVGQRTRVHGDQADPVRQHVVHLARDPGPLVGAALVHPELLLGLGALGAVAQRPQQLAPGAEVHPPDQHRDREREAEREVDPPRARWAASARSSGRPSADHAAARRPARSARPPGGWPARPTPGPRALPRSAETVPARAVVTSATVSGHRRRKKRQRQGRQPQPEVEPEQRPGLLPLHRGARGPQRRR